MIMHFGHSCWQPVAMQYYGPHQAESVILFPWWTGSLWFHFTDIISVIIVNVEKVEPQALSFLLLSVNFFFQVLHLAHKHQGPVTAVSHLVPKASGNISWEAGWTVTTNPRTLTAFSNVVSWLRLRLSKWRVLLSQSYFLVFLGRLPVTTPL